jgi:hypothetical protein
VFFLLLLLPQFPRPFLHRHYSIVGFLKLQTKDI